MYAHCIFVAILCDVELCGCFAVLTRTSPSAWVYNLTLNYTIDLLFGRRKYKSFQQSAIDIQLLVMKQTTQTDREPSNYSHLISQTKLHDSKNGV